MQLDHSKLVKGATIQYVLLSSQQPTHPDKLWHGKVTSLSIGNIVQIESTEPGYEGQTELVHCSQIRAIETHI